jgi:hypothetical protein
MSKMHDLKMGMYLSTRVAGLEPLVNQRFEPM